MSEVTIWETIERGGSGLFGVEVDVSLIASVEDSWAPGYAASVTLLDVATIKTTAAGLFEAVVVPVSELTPDGCVYKLVYRLPRSGARTIVHVEPAAPRTITDGVFNGTTTITSATANFTSDDVGKSVEGTGIPTGTTIASRTSTTSVVLSAATTTSGSGKTVVINGRQRVADILAEEPASLASPALTTYMARAPRGPGLRAAAIGDSNTLGYGTAGASTYWQAEQSWYTQAVHGSRGLLRHVKNDGIASTTSTAMADRIEANVLALDVDVCFIMAGTNDNNASTTTALETTIANIAYMVEACRAAGATPVVLTIPPREDAYKDEALLVNGALTYWCAANRVDLIDAYAEVVDPATGDFADGMNQDTLHLSVAGAQRVAQRVVDWAYAHCTSGGPFRAAWDDEAGINLVAGANFAGPLGGSNAPPGWSIAGEVTGDTTFALVEPVEADHFPTRMRGNWYEITKDESALSTYITQVISTGFAVGDTIAFSGRVQVPDALTGDGEFGLYISFTGSDSIFLFPLYEWTQDCDAAFYIERTIPAGTTAIALFANFARNAGDISGVVRFGEVTVVNLSDQEWSLL